MKLGFTGTREGMSPYQKTEFVRLLTEIQPTEFHHGMCVGADAEAHELVRRHLPNTKIIGHRPEKSDLIAKGLLYDDIMTAQPYLTRNRNIVNASDKFIGCPLGPEIARSGTWQAIRFARKKQKRRPSMEVVVIDRGGQ